MQPKQTIQLLLLLLIWTGCKQKDNHAQVLSSNTATNTTTTYQNSKEPAEETQTITTATTEEPSHYNDGVYCADVRYSNSNTGNNSIYILNVEVEDGKLRKINWPNGGWLDETHFTPPHINQNGFTTFVSDKGYQYDVLIKTFGNCDYSTSNSFNRYSDTRSQGTTSDEEEEDEDTKLENEYGSVKAVVYKRVSGCDYMILEERGDYYVAEWMGRYDPNEGDRIQGDLRHFGTKTCYVRNKDRESRLYIEDFRISLSRAWEIIRDKCNLEDKDNDQ